MNRFFLVTTHYAKRAFRNVMDVLLLLGIPLGLIVIFGMIGFGGDSEALLLNGYNVMTSNFAPAFMLSFQFFSGGTMLLLLHMDLKADMKWRLRAAPCSLKTFIAPAFFANWLFSMTLGAIIIGITALFLNVYWGNLLI